MFSRRQILTPVLLILLLSWAANGPTKLGSAGRTIGSSPQGPTPQSPPSVDWLPPGDLPAPFQLLASNLRAGATPTAPNLFLHPEPDAEAGLGQCDGCRIDVSFLDPFPIADAEGEATFSPPVGLLASSAVVMGVAVPFLSGGHLNRFTGSAPLSTATVGTPVPEAGSGLLVLLGLAGLIVASSSRAQSRQERCPSRAMRPGLDRARLRNFIAS